MTGLLTLLMLIGCRPDFFSLDEACDDKVPGYQKGAPEVYTTFLRWNCHRRLVKLAPARVERNVLAATTSHVNYMWTNEILSSGDDWTTESSSGAGYTGFDIFDRFTYHGYDIQDVGGTGVWTVGFYMPLVADQLIDFWMHDPYVREALLQPGFRDGGYAQSPEVADGWQYVNLDLVYDWPPEQRSRNPIVYPKEGQVLVPPNHWPSSTADPIYAMAPGEMVGYPITVTVGSDEANTAFDASNPYGLFVVNYELTGPEGAVDTTVIPPTSYAGVWPRYTLIFVPQEPLAENTEYSFVANIEWSGGRKLVESTFTTGSTVDRFSGFRQAPAGPFIQHLPPGSLEALRGAAPRPY